MHDGVFCMDGLRRITDLAGKHPHAASHAGIYPYAVYRCQQAEGDVGNSWSYSGKAKSIPIPMHDQDGESAVRSEENP